MKFSIIALDYGCANAIEVERRYTADEAPLGKGKYLIIKIHNEMIAERGSVYEAVRRSWKIDIDKVQGRPVIACVQGVIKGVYCNCIWQKSKEEPSRYFFDGEKVDDEMWGRYVNKRIPKRFCEKHAASPIRYT